MSVERMSAVFKSSKQAGNLRLLLLAIADNADDHGHAWPGIKTLAEKTLISTRTIMRAVEEVWVNSGELLVFKQEGASNQYLVLTGFSEAERKTAITLFCRKLNTSPEELERQRQDAARAHTVKKERERERHFKATRDKLSRVAGSDAMASPGGDKLAGGGDKLTRGGDAIASPGSDTAASPESSLTPKETVKETISNHQSGVAGAPPVPSGNPEPVSDSRSGQPSPAQPGKSAASGRASTITRKRIPDAIFDAIAECAFRIPPGETIGKDTGGRVGKIKAEVLAGFGDNPPSADEIRTAFTWWDAAKRIDRPRDPAKVIAMIGEYREKGHHYAGLEADTDDETLPDVDDRPALPAPSDDDVVTWAAALAQLESTLNRATFQTWLKDVTLLGVEGGTYVLSARDAYTKDWLEKRLYRPIRRAVGDAAGRSAEVRFVVVEPVDTKALLGPSPFGEGEDAKAVAR